MIVPGGTPRRRVFPVLLVVALAGAVALAPAGAAGPPEHTLTVTGAGTETYPAFDEGISRYGIRTDATTGGAVTVTASTSDAGGTITVNGRPAQNGVGVELVGVGSGEEIAVQITDQAGTATYALIYLPAGFPVLEATTHGPGVGDGLVFLDLVRFSDAPGFETVVDGHGVPVYVNPTAERTWDFKRQPDGRYSVARQTSTSGQPDFEIVALDAAFEEVAAYETVNRTNTDNHDAVLDPDGSRILLAYESVIDAQGWFWHSDIEEVDSSGAVSFEWSSRDHVPRADNLTPNTVDYAHINSVERMADGDLLASFRNTSQVMKIARTAHDGHQPGDVVWRLGGVSSDFTFVDDPHGGPCAQHHAQELPNGNILLFDNGSQANPLFLPNAADMCPDPGAPNGPRVARTFSRAVEYDIDEEAGTATLVWSYDQGQEVFGVFTGSVQRLDDGNTLIGWGTASPVATEVDASGTKLWELTAAAPDGNDDYWTYRAFRFPAPDAITPEVDLVAPAQGEVFVQGQVVLADYGCSDRGGSNLVSCADADAAVDTSVPGEHPFAVRAADGAGNETTVTHTYTVLDVADLTGPAVELAVPPDGAVYDRDEAVTVDFSCADEPGGSGLDTCTGSTGDGEPLDTATVGDRDLTVMATDNDGNETTVTHTYTVSDHQPDGRIRRGTEAQLRGDGVYNTDGTGQTRAAAAPRGQMVTFWVSAQNDGNAPQALRLRAQPSTRHFIVRYASRGADITAAMTDGTYLTPVLAAGEGRAIRVQVTVGGQAARPRSVTRSVTLTSVEDPTRQDVVRFAVSRR